MKVIRLDLRTMRLPLPPEVARPYCRELEAGAILHLGPSPVRLPPDDLSFLHSRRQTGAFYHKNVAYRPKQGRMTGYSGLDAARMAAVLSRFSHYALQFLGEFLTPYRFDVDYASFRPLEERGRVAKLKARNDLLHVDSFPTRPSRGRRILRMFVNVNPTEARIWKAGPAFADLAGEMAAPSGLLERYRQDVSRPGWQSSMVEVLGRMGMARYFRPPYDRFMLSFHDWLKGNQGFQNGAHSIVGFEPMSSWMCMTDTASHAVLSGRLALEQTVLVRPETQQAPELAPAAILEALSRSSRTQPVAAA